MLGEYVMTQFDRTTFISKNDTIGLGSYNIDTHNAQRFPQDGITLNDGDVERTYANSFEIPYRYGLLSFWFFSFFAFYSFLPVLFSFLFLNLLFRF